MENTTMLPQQIEYQTTAKQLYHVALYTVGDAALAEQTAGGAFSDALERYRDLSDIELFRRCSHRLLYRYCKKIRQQYDHFNNRIDAGIPDSLQCASDKKHLEKMLGSLNFQERYIVLLFCLQKFSIHQISEIIRLPCFVIEKRLNAAAGKTV